MKLIREPDELQALALSFRASGKTIALVPTMGNLHAGHASLMDIARPQADILIVSDFVNPTQFGPNEDFDAYPRTLEADMALAEAHGVDILFAPAASSIYKADASTFVKENSCSQGLCGRSRPVHFQGVCTVVNLLFNLAVPHLAVFGQKDAQQVAVLKRMVRDLHIPVKLLVAPIVRESDGLALSSRNQYLTAEERAAAPQIHVALQALSAAVSAGERVPAKLEKLFKETLSAASDLFEPQYLEFVDRETMAPLEKVVPAGTLVATAVYMKKTRTRLIDNILL
ncbi:MAG: pantoate--beta-alanine ligase [Opitutales bacterium]|nr:pantoate--beta-alanine ligase [Opitutales bacterium]